MREYEIQKELDIFDGAEREEVVGGIRDLIKEKTEEFERRRDPAKMVLWVDASSTQGEYGIFDDGVWSVDENGNCYEGEESVHLFSVSFDGGEQEKEFEAWKKCRELAPALAVKALRLKRVEEELGKIKAELEPLKADNEWLSKEVLRLNISDPLPGLKSVRTSDATLEKLKDHLRRTM